MSLTEQKTPDHAPGLAHSSSSGSITGDPEERLNSYLTSSSPGHKIINRMRKAIKENKRFYSFEFFPPKTEAGVMNLYTRLERMSLLGPTFMDVTWGAGGTTADLTLEISKNAQNLTSTEVMMHLTCTNIDKEKVAQALREARAAGIRNILALRGDPPKGQDVWEATDGGFEHAVDLVRFIRKEHGDFFGIAVAGYPEGHVTATSIDEDIRRLKEKVDAGADFVITQLFYDVEKFFAFRNKCKEIGINVPIIPGVMPIQNYNGFKRMCGFCKTYVPDEINQALEPIKDDDGAVKAYGIELGIRMCRQLLEGGVEGLHFYTLNLERSVTRILAGLEFIRLESAKKGVAVELPWQSSKLTCRKKEDVRPIFWANRPLSYLARTQDWDEFPNGRWGDARSPAFGDLFDYHLMSFKTGNPKERRSLWGEAPTSEQDIFDVFAQYVSANLSRLPWCETPVHRETLPIKPRLAAVNKAGYLTINSQPRVNGLPSDDPSVGWGGKGGYVYQKAYLEFFVSREKLDALIKKAAEIPSLTYHAVNAKGESLHNLKTEKGVCAVTWGVFPDAEVLQPTVVDPQSFLVWKDEAFGLWQSQWQSIYEPNSVSYNLIGRIHDTYYLVNLVDHNYINGDIFKVFEDLSA